MKKMVRNEDAFTQRFRTAKVVRIWFFFSVWPQNQKKASPDPFHENMVRQKYLVRTVTFLWVPFFCSVNEALGYIHIILDSFSWHGYPVWYKQLLYGPGFLICYVVFLLNEEKSLKS